MKHFILNVLFVAGMAGMATAQNFRLNAYSAYCFNDRVDSKYSSSNYYDGTINGGYQWGFGAEYMLKPSIGIELMYKRQNASAPMDYFDGIKHNRDFNLGLNYILIDGNKYFKTANKKIEPFVGAGLGVAIINISNPIEDGDNSLTKFAFNLKAGTNYWLTKRIGLKFEATLVSAVNAASNGFYFKQNFVGSNLTSYKTVMQFGLGGGLTFKIGK